MNVLFLGCGNMGGAMLEAWLPLLGRDWQEVWLLRMACEQRRKLEATPGYALLDRHFHHAASFAELEQAVRKRGTHFSLIVLGMKPQVIHREFGNCLAFGRDGCLWLSMAAGLPVAWYNHYGHSGQPVGKSGLRLVRIMPNLGARLGRSASLLYKAPELELSPAEKLLLEKLARGLGCFVWCEAEAQLDNATAITGSGPAYFYLLTELLQKELEKQGFAAEAARQLAEATFLGSAAYLADQQQEESEGLASRLRGAVSSRAGVTEAALSLLMPEFEHAVAAAVERGIARARELRDG